ncbi:hypothetical protein GGR57DRAFT_469626 [Xylariaceae sp. FL1272]|nr:hypothetical protein GGR57DRAFT_469626 [Xylariaceae sp. FL1272]
MPTLSSREAMADEDVVLITQLPSDSWFEGFVVRPNGKVLVTRLDKPELYTFDPQDQDTEPRPIHTFSEHNSLVNLTSIPGYDDEYYLLASTADLEVITQKDVWAYRVAFGDDDSLPPKVTRLTKVEEEGYIVGILAITDRIALLTDAKSGKLFHLDIGTGKKTTFVDDERMKHSDLKYFFGINRVRIVGDFLYFTNTCAGTLSRMAIEVDTEHKDVGIRAIGAVSSVIDGMPAHIDGLAISANQSHAYVASQVDGKLHRIEIDPETGVGTSTVILGSLDSPTGLNLVEGTSEGKKPKLFIICCGEIEVAWTVSEVDPWKEIRDLNAALTVVSVTEQVVTTTIAI